MANSKLTKILYTEITRLKLCNKPDASPRFLLDKSPFDDDDEGETTGGAQAKKECVIIGRILPNSDIYNQAAFKIEIKLPDSFPIDPPYVRFLTPIYHPNVNREGEFCHKLLKRTEKWKMDIPLVDVVKAVVERIDQPDLDSASFTVGKEYMENRAEFNRKALESVKKNGLPRN